MILPRPKDRHHRQNPLTKEMGTIRRHAPVRIALGYPAAYKVAASSLGYQTMYRLLNSNESVVCERFFMPENIPQSKDLLTAESDFPISRCACIALSVACETELLNVASLLIAAGMHPLSKERRDNDPPVVIGGPITMVDPKLIAGMADAVVVGDGEEAATILCNSLTDQLTKSDFLKNLSMAGAGLWVPKIQLEPPDAAHAPSSMLPAYAVTWSPDAELKDLFLVEVGRGCNRGCAFCVMSRRADSSCGFRQVGAKQILETIPPDVPGVGLVGAAVTDHKEIENLVKTIVARGQRVSLSSVRADRLTANLVESLVAGGLRTLTIAVDGSSQKLRRSINKGITVDHLEQAVKLAVEADLKHLKVYSMIGLPSETDADIDEFATLLLGFDKRLRISVAVQAFVPKPSTPMASVPMEKISVIRKRLDRLKRQLKGRVKVMPTSPRWSWIDWKIANSGMAASEIAYAAYLKGGNFAAWKTSIKEILEIKIK